MLSYYCLGYDLLETAVLIILRVMVMADLLRNSIRLDQKLILQ